MQKIIVQAHLDFELVRWQICPRSFPATLRVKWDVEIARAVRLSTEIRQYAQRMLIFSVKYDWHDCKCYVI